jgi:hypothetical protein
MAMYL